MFIHCPFIVCIKQYSHYTITQTLNKKNSVHTQTMHTIRKDGDTMTIISPYMKYDNWYVPGCNIAFPSDSEAWEYIYENNLL